MHSSGVYLYRITASHKVSLISLTSTLCISSSLSNLQVPTHLSPDPPVPRNKHRARPGGKAEAEVAHHVGRRAESRRPGTDEAAFVVLGTDRTRQRSEADEVGLRGVRLDLERQQMPKNTSK